MNVNLFNACAKLCKSIPHYGIQLSDSMDQSPSPSFTS